MVEGGFVQVEPGLEWSFRQTQVLLFTIAGGNRRFIDDTFLQAITFQGALGLSSAVACLPVVLLQWDWLAAC